MVHEEQRLQAPSQTREEEKRRERFSAQVFHRMD